MKYALIPPRGYETSALQSNFHLMLAQVKTPAYVETYKEALRRGDYVVLDNGAAEGEAVDDWELLLLASRLDVSEVVMPDVMLESRATVTRVKRFIRIYLDSKYTLNNNVKFMAVVQGSTPDELQYCIAQYASLSIIGVLGLPRHLLTTLQDNDIRRRLADTINERWPGRFQIHLLGTSPYHISEIASFKDGVRSVDTSAPYNYAMASVALEADLSVKRPENYFGRTRHIDPGLLQNNIAVYKEWASGIESTASEL